MRSAISSSSPNKRSVLIASAVRRSNRSGPSQSPGILVTESASGSSECGDVKKAHRALPACWAFLPSFLAFLFFPCAIRGHYSDDKDARARGVQAMYFQHSMLMPQMESDFPRKCCPMCMIGGKCVCFRVKTVKVSGHLLTMTKSYSGSGAFSVRLLARNCNSSNIL